MREAIVRARTEAQARRARIDAATRDYETFLTQRAIPLFRTFANALAGEGLRFAVFTPAGSVKLASESGGGDFIELVLDTSGDAPEVVGRSSRGRGRRLVTSERPIRQGTPVSALTEEDLLNYLVDEIQPFVARTS